MPTALATCRGFARRLDYVASLEVHAIWISPFFKSPVTDFGYDISDFRAVEPLFGRFADFDRLAVEAHRLGLRVLIDQMMSHTSSQHHPAGEPPLSRGHSPAARCPPPGTAALGEISSRDSLATMAEYLGVGRLHMAYSFELLTE